MGRRSRPHGPAEPPRVGVGAFMGSAGDGRLVFLIGGDMNLVGDTFIWGVQTNLVGFQKSSTGELDFVSADPAKLVHAPTVHARDWIVSGRPWRRRNRL